MFFGGDVLPEPEELIRKFVAKYDYDGRKAMELRDEFGHKAAAEKWKCLFYHSKSKSQAFIAADETHLGRIQQADNFVDVIDLQG